MENGTLRRKTKQKLSFECIDEVFRRKRAPCGIMASFMRYKPGAPTNAAKVIMEFWGEKEFGKCKIINIRELFRWKMKLFLGQN